MSEEQIKQKLEAIENTRKSKKKDRELNEKMLRELRTPKKLEQLHMKTIAHLVELTFENNQETENDLLALREQTLNIELRLLKIEKTVEQLKQAIDWSEQNR